jgi:putative ABC transport system permease protein
MEWFLSVKIPLTDVQFNVQALGFAISIAATIISSIYPAWVASRVDIVEALQK